MYLQALSLTEITEANSLVEIEVLWKIRSLSFSMTKTCLQTRSQHAYWRYPEALAEICEALAEICAAKPAFLS